MPTQTYSTAGTYIWTCPAGVTSVQVECWGPGGNGGNSISSFGGWAGGGGGGGAYAKRNAVSVVPGVNYSVVVPAGNSQTPATFASVACLADYGRSGTAPPAAFQFGTGGGAGQAVNSTGDVRTSGTAGENGVNPYGGAGGGAGNGGGLAITGNPGTTPGGGGAGGGTGGWPTLGAAGAAGKVLLTWADPVVTGSGTSRVASASSGTGGEAFIGTGASQVAPASSGACSEGFNGAGSSSVKPEATGAGVNNASGSVVFCGVDGSGVYVPPAVDGTGTSKAAPGQSGEGVLEFKGAGTGRVITSATGGTGSLVFSGTGSSQALVGTLGSGAIIALVVRWPKSVQALRVPF